MRRASVSQSPSAVGALVGFEDGLGHADQGGHQQPDVGLGERLVEPPPGHNGLYLLDLEVDLSRGERFQRLLASLLDQALEPLSPTAVEVGQRFTIRYLKVNGTLMDSPPRRGISTLDSKVGACAMLNFFAMTVP